MESWIKFTPDSFATWEDWETVCEEAGVDPEETQELKIFISHIEVVK